MVALLAAEREAGVRISFSGKADANRLARKVRPRVQRVVKKYCAGTPEEQAGNLVVEGDNLQALVTLYRERNKVDLILADPPYNTGKDFRYNDKWEDDPNDPDLGEIVSSDDGARHTKWMRFMWPRLQMMRSMLKPGGILAICIDHRELFRLGQMLDELFRQENRVAIINWQRAATRRNDKGGQSGQGGVSTSTEYVLVYANDRDLSKTQLEARGEDSGYRNPDDDPDGDWSGVDPFAPGAATHQGMVYAVQSPFTGVMHYPPGNKCWANEKAWVKGRLELWGSDYEERDLGDGKAPGLLLKGAEYPLRKEPASDPAVAKAAKQARKVGAGVLPELFFTKKGLGRPRRKAYLAKIKQGLVPTTYWAADDLSDPITLGSTSWGHAESGTSEVGSRELAAIIGEGHGFETVKPQRLFQKVIQLWCPRDGLVLDPFAGSGTTGHAVLALNDQTDAERNFIMIEQGRPEKGDSYARTLTAERLKRLISGSWATGPQDPLPGGFQFVKLDRKVDAAGLLQMERDEMVDTVIASYFDGSQRRGQGLVRLADPEYVYLVARNGDNEGFFLVWNGPGANTDIDEEVYEACAEEARDADLRAVYHVYARFNHWQTDNLRFYQIPDRVLTDFGLDVRSEPFEGEE